MEKVIAVTERIEKIFDHGASTLTHLALFDQILLETRESQEQNSKVPFAFSPDLKNCEGKLDLQQKIIRTTTRWRINLH